MWLQDYALLDGERSTKTGRDKPVGTDPVEAKDNCILSVYYVQFLSVIMIWEFIAEYFVWVLWLAIVDQALFVK